MAHSTIEETIAKLGVPVYVVAPRGNKKSSMAFEKLMALMASGFKIMPFAKVKKESNNARVEEPK